MTDNVIVLAKLTSENLAVISVIKNLRQSDKNEISRATGRQPATEIFTSWNDSAKKWVVYKNGNPIALFGVDTADGHNGSPWFVATDEVSTIKSFIAKNSKKYIQEMQEGLSLLHNFVLAENTTSIKWLKWCGFTVDPPIKYGPFNSLFHPFYMDI